MRALFVCQPAYGHFHPLVPLAAACEDAGHDVAFAVSPSFAPVVEAAGFEAVPAGLDWLESAAEKSFPEVAGMSNAEYGGFLFGAVFLGHAAAAMAGDLPGVCEQWGADILVHEEFEFGTPLAGERAGLAWAGVSLSPVWHPAATAAWLAPSLDAVRTDLGLRVDPGLERHYGALHLAALPPSFQAAPTPGDWRPNLHPLRPVPYDGPDPAPGWLDEHTDDDRPLVLVTLGTVFNRRGSHVLRTVVDALAREPVRVVVALGGSLSPDALAPLPGNTRAVSWLPLAAAARAADVVVGHGGWGTTMATLTAGRPSLVLPQGGDQYLNAFRVAACGAGLRLVAGDVTAERLRDAVRDLLDDPVYFANARRLRRELEAMPGPAEAVPLLVAAAGRHAPTA
ncbi:MAG: glycosyltransferase [Actinobacteria bacterium]|nr:glycosyltransferase [Actinomycetota bacterium]